MTFLYPEILFLLPGGVLVAFIYRWGMEKSWARFRGWKPGRPLTRVWLRPALWGGAGCLVILALAGPAGEQKEATTGSKGQSVVFLVDVSWSMLTEDMAPNRMEATRSALTRLIPDLEGDQAGVAVFSGTTVILSPLTSDLGFLTQTLRSLRAGQASRGGTLVGDALRQVSQTFGKSSGPLTLWLFTDGGDQESFPLEAAADLGKAGHRLMIWGLGTDEGGQVPDREVASRLNRSLLQSMAAATEGGGYFEGDPQGFPRIYAETRRLDSTREFRRTEREDLGYWLVLGAFLLILVETVLGYSLMWRNHEA